MDDGRRRALAIIADGLGLVEGFGGRGEGVLGGVLDSSLRRGAGGVGEGLGVDGVGQRWGGGRGRDEEDEEPKGEETRKEQRYWTGSSHRACDGHRGRLDGRRGVEMRAVMLV